MSFADKVVLVTGGSSGIGAAAAIAFAKEGAKVAIVGRNEAKLAAVASGCTGHDPLVLRADFADSTQVATLVQRTVEKFGKLDILVNNAGTLCTVEAEGSFEAAYDKVMAINLRAVIQLTTLAAPHLIKTKGNIVNISSAAGWRGVPEYYMTYGITKAGVNHFTKAAALELAPHGVRVNTISPGPVRTDILENMGFAGVWDDFLHTTALYRVSESEEIADLILFLASEKAKSITGSNYLADNGQLLI